MRPVCLNRGSASGMFAVWECSAICLKKSSLESERKATVPSVPSCNKSWSRPY